MSVDTVHMLGWALVAFGLPLFFYCIYNAVKCCSSCEYEVEVVQSGNNAKTQHVTIVNSSESVSKPDISEILEKCGKGLEGVGTIPSMTVDNIFAPQC